MRTRNDHLQLNKSGHIIGDSSNYDILYIFSSLREVETKKKNLCTNLNPSPPETAWIDFASLDLCW